MSEVGAILSSDGAAVVLNVNKLATPGKTLPDAYQSTEYKSALFSFSIVNLLTHNDTNIIIIPHKTSCPCYNYTDFQAIKQDSC